MPKRTFHAYETRIYTLRFHFPSLFDTFNTFNTFKWCIMTSYKSIIMIKVTKLSNYIYIYLYIGLIRHVNSIARCLLPCYLVGNTKYDINIFDISLCICACVKDYKSRSTETGRPNSANGNAPFHINWVCEWKSNVKLTHREYVNNTKCIQMKVINIRHKIGTP